MPKGEKKGLLMCLDKETRRYYSWCTSHGARHAIPLCDAHVMRVWTVPFRRRYVGGYANARRHGRGTWRDNEGGLMLTYFDMGAPTGEGAKIMASGEIQRTHAGKPDGKIDYVEASAIAKNAGLRECHPKPKAWMTHRAIRIVLFAHRVTLSCPSDS